MKATYGGAFERSRARAAQRSGADLWEGPNEAEMRVPPLVAGCGEKPPRSPAPAAERPDRRKGQHGDEVWVAHALLVAVGCEPDA